MEEEVEAGRVPLAPDEGSLAASEVVLSSGDSTVIVGGVASTGG